MTIRVRMTAAAVGGAVLLTGCATSAVISDLEEDKVIVEARGNNAAVIDAEARRGCAIHGRTAVPISKKCIDEYCIRAQHLFACKKQ